MEKKYGKDFYKKMGSLGGRKSIYMTDKEELKERLKKMFRKSFRTRHFFDGQRFRSKKEIEVAILLKARKISFEYEKQIFGFYPDFTLDNKTIIEVVGFEWKDHIDRTKAKIEKLISNNFTVILYTYPNMVKYFDKFPIGIYTEIDKLDEVLGYNRS